MVSKDDALGSKAWQRWLGDWMEFNPEYSARNDHIQRLINELVAAESRDVESEREAGILRDALAESERLRVAAEAEAAHDRAELSTVIAARDKAIDDRNEWRHGYERETNRAAQAEAERDELKMKTDLATGNYERSFHISEKLREERDEALERVAILEEQALHRSYSLTDEERAKWDAVTAYEEAAQELHDAQAKVSALTALVAQSSTQYREMVAELDDLMLYYTIKHDGWRSEGLDILAGVVARIEARREAERSTP